MIVGVRPPKVRGFVTSWFEIEIDHAVLGEGAIGWEHCYLDTTSSEAIYVDVHSKIVAGPLAFENGGSPATEWLLKAVEVCKSVRRRSRPRTTVAPIHKKVTIVFVRVPGGTGPGNIDTRLQYGGSVSGIRQDGGGCALLVPC